VNALPAPRALEDAHWLTEFIPRRWLRNGHLQTLAGNFLPRRLALNAASAIKGAKSSNTVATSSVARTGVLSK